MKNQITRRCFIKTAAAADGVIAVPDHSLVNPFGEKTDRAWMYAPEEVALEPTGPVDSEVAFLAVQHANGPTHWLCLPTSASKN